MTPFLHQCGDRTEGLDVGGVGLGPKEDLRVGRRVVWWSGCNLLYSIAYLTKYNNIYRAGRRCRRCYHLFNSSRSW